MHGPGGAADPYSYVDGAVATATDPDGLCSYDNLSSNPCNAFDGALGGIFGAMIGAITGALEGNPGGGQGASGPWTPAPAAPTYRTGIVNAAVSFPVMRGIMGYDAGHPFPWLTGPAVGYGGGDPAARPVLGALVGTALFAIAWEAGLGELVYTGGAALVNAVGELPAMINLASMGGLGTALAVQYPGLSQALTSAANAAGGNDTLSSLEFQEARASAAAVPAARASVGDLLAMMNKRQGVTASFAVGDEAAY